MQYPQEIWPVSRVRVPRDTLSVSCAKKTALNPLQEPLGDSDGHGHEGEDEDQECQEGAEAAWGVGALGARLARKVS